MSLAVALAACSNNSGQTGVQEDGDSATRLNNSTIGTPADGQTDTAGAFGEDRTDTQKRDSL